MESHSTELVIGNKEFLDNILWFLLSKSELDTIFS